MRLIQGTALGVDHYVERFPGTTSDKRPELSSRAREKNEERCTDTHILKTTNADTHTRLHHLNGIGHIRDGHTFAVSAGRDSAGSAAEPRHC